MRGIKLQVTGCFTDNARKRHRRTRLRQMVIAGFILIAPALTGCEPQNENPPSDQAVDNPAAIAKDKAASIAADDAAPHHWWGAQMFRTMGDCFDNGGSPAREIKDEQAQGKEPTVIENRNSDGYIVSVEVHDEGSFATYYRSKADCDAANPVHAVDADNYR